LSGWGTLPPKEQARRLAAFRKKWQFQLRRLYPGGDFSALAPALVQAATEALLSFVDSRSGIESDVSLIMANEPGPGAT
jgi:hypothetical protein